MRLCPTVDGNDAPLITHRISVDVCLARQGTFYHKCHRCQFRGKAADWEPECGPAMLDVHATGTPSRAAARQARQPEAATPAPARAAERKPARTRAARKAPAGREAAAE